jgi:hypothetical protein
MTFLNSTVASTRSIPFAHTSIYNTVQERKHPTIGTFDRPLSKLLSARRQFFNTFYKSSLALVLL